MKTQFFFCLCFLQIQLLFSEKIIVDQRKGSSIKQAITQAKPGDTLIIKAGVYQEGNIILDKPLVLIGEGFPVLDGQKKYEIITIHSNDVTVSGLKLIETGAAGMQDIAAIKIVDSKRVRITGNKFV